MEIKWYKVEDTYPKNIGIYLVIAKSNFDGTNYYTTELYTPENKFYDSIYKKTINVIVWAELPDTENVLKDLEANNGN